MFFGRIFKASLHIRLCYLQTGNFMSSFPVWTAFVAAPTLLFATQSCGWRILTAEQHSRAVPQIMLLSVGVRLPYGFWLSPVEVLCCCSVAQSCPALCSPWTAACQASLSFSIFLSLLKLMSTESVMPSSHLILCHCLLLLPSTWKFFSDLTIPFIWGPKTEYLVLHTKQTFNTKGMTGQLMKYLKSRLAGSWAGVLLFKTTKTCPEWMCQLVSPRQHSRMLTLHPCRDCVSQPLISAVPVGVTLEDTLAWTNLSGD